MSKASSNRWRPQWRYRRFDGWKSLREGRQEWRPLSFGKRYLTKLGQARILRHYGFEVIQHPLRQQAVQVSPSVDVAPDRLIRFLGHVERSPALRSLHRVTLGIRRIYGLPNRTRYKQS